MSNLSIVKDAEAIALNRIGQVAKYRRHYNCPQCVQVLGARKVQVASDKRVVHGKCRDLYEQVLREKRDAEERAKKKEEIAAKEILRKALIKYRGTDLDAFCKELRSGEIKSPGENSIAWREFGFFDNVRTGMKSAQKELDRWIKRVSEEDAKAAFTWSEGAFAAAAKLDVLKQIEGMFKHGMIHQDILAHAQRTTMQLAQYTNRSTSITSNLIEDETRAAWANVAERSWI